MITNIGINEISNFVSTKYSIVAVGTGNVPVSMNDTSLSNEVIRGSTTNSITTTNTTNDTATFIRRITNTSSSSLKEIGLFDSSNKIFFRELFDSEAYIPVGQNFDLVINIISKEVD
jgi:hypothetical protein